MDDRTTVAANSPVDHLIARLARVNRARLRSLDMGAEAVGVLAFEDGLSPDHLTALTPVANRAIAHHALDVLESAGFREIFVVSSTAAASDVRACLAGRETQGDVELTYLDGAGPLDLRASLSVAAEAVGGRPCVFHLGNGMLADPLTPFMEHLRTDSPDVVWFVHTGAAPDRHLNGSARKMLHVEQLHPDRAALGLAGVLLLGPGALGHLIRARWQASGNVELTSVADQIAEAGGNLRLLMVQKWCRYAGDPIDLLDLNRIALDRLDREVHRFAHDGNQIEGRVWIDHRASVGASVIVGPVIIGPGAIIADSYIGPYTSVGAGARIEGAEIERSIISAGASIMHIGGRLVASVVGRDARVFRDFSLPKALRLRVGDGTEVALC
jgi:glucose-1-phosphate thymidylyltransferase